MIAEQVYRAIESWVYNHDFKLRNVFVHAWEADHFSVTSSKYSYEIEVKVSRSDFFCDAKKPKHGLFKGYKKGWSILRGWERENETHITPLQLNHTNCPNKFIYACPAGLIDPHEVPEYAGLVWVMDAYKEVRIMKKAPFLHKDAFNHRKMLFDKYYYRWIQVSNRNKELEHELSRMKTLPI